MRIILVSCLFLFTIATLSAFENEDWKSMITLPSGFEPSGIAWHSRLKRLIIVSDEGQIITCNIDGTDIVHITGLLGHDLEGVTVADANSNFVYVAIEDPPAIAEVDIVNLDIHREFPLEQAILNLQLESTKIQSSEKTVNKKEKKKGKPNKKSKPEKAAKFIGIEALAFVPDSSDPEGGSFFAGMQQSGVILVIQLPIRSSQASTSHRIVRVLYPTPLRTDLSGMEYYDGYLYATYDKHDLLVAMRPDASIVHQWTLPKDGQEGVVVVPVSDTHVMLFFCEDSGKDVPSAIWGLELPLKELPSYSFCEHDTTLLK